MCLLISVILLLGAGTAVFTRLHKKYLINVYHPGQVGTKSPMFTLVEEKTDVDSSAQFYMDVVSVYCFDSICKIDTVRLFWNDIGTYIRYQLPPSIYLEKAEGKKFTDDEYERLQMILMDKYSPFAKLAIDKVVKSNDVEHGMELDGYSGATVIELNEKESVKGAALTCYTLWHWANGAVCDSIREITGDALSVEQLQGLLNVGNDSYKVFALEQLTKKSICDKVTVEAVITVEIKDLNSWSKLQVLYLEAAPDAVYFDGVQRLLGNGEKQKRLTILQSLNKTEKEARQGYYDGLCTCLPYLKSYREVDLFISLMEKKNASSAKIIESILNLLDENILIARRAYWFLTNKELNETQQKVLDEFYKENEDYL